MVKKWKGREGYIPNETIPPNKYFNNATFFSGENLFIEEAWRTTR